METHFTAFRAGTDAAPDLGNVLIMQIGFAKGHWCVEMGGKLTSYNPENPDHEGKEKIPQYVDGTTIQQVSECGQGRNVACNLDHGQTVKDIVAKYNNFRVIGDGVRAAITPNVKHKEYNTLMDLIENFADEVGNSAKFKATFELAKQGAQKVALVRCHFLKCVDIVDQPATTNALFENTETIMADEETTPPVDVSPDPANAHQETLDNIGAQLTNIIAMVTKLMPKDDPEPAAESADPPAKDDEEKMSIAAMRAVTTELQRYGIRPLPAAEPKKLKATPWADALAGAKALGAKNDGEAIIMIRNTNPTLYNAHAEGLVTL